MIGDKKIKSAAQGYCDATYGTLDEHPLIAEAFEQGAKWAIDESLKDSWHSIEEKPEKEKTFLYQTSFGGFGLNQVSDKKDWDFIIKYQKATKWIYIEDLSPKQKGE